jgi:peptide/nickel transport system substrate-binding protein
MRGGNTAPTASDSAAAALPVVDWDAAAAGDVQDGGTLNLAVGALPANYNNSQIDGNDVDTNTLSPTSGGRCGSRPTAPSEVNPDYASSVELVSEDPQVVEIKLNPKAVWEDGTPITVADYVATWKALNGSNADYQVVSTTGWDQIDPSSRAPTSSTSRSPSARSSPTGSRCSAACSRGHRE